MELDPYSDQSLYQIESIKPMKKFKRICRLIDLYALPITLRYKQEKKFFTNYGACTSITIILVMLAFAANFLTQMFNDEDTTEANFTKLIKNKDKEKYPNGDFLFGFKITDKDDQPFWDESIIQWKVVTNKSIYNEALDVRENFQTTYFLSPCLEYYTNSTLPDRIQLDPFDYEGSDLNSYVCPIDLLQDFIQETKYESNFTSTELLISICDSTVSTCADAATIETTVNELKVEFFFLNANFDGQNITIPVDYYLDFNL